MIADWKPVDRWLMGESWVGSRIPAHFDALCDEIGPRWGGSECERRAAEYVRDQLQAADLAGPRLEEFTLRTWDCLDAGILVEGHDSWKLDVRPCLYCPSVAVDGPLVDVGYGMGPTFERFGEGLKGAVALIDSGFEPFTAPRPLDVRLADLARAGVAAAITPSPYGGRRTQQMVVSDWRDGDLTQVPLAVVQTSREDGARLKRLVGGGARVSVVVRADFRTTPSWNTVADLAGSRWPEEHLILEAHHDTTPDSFGANDNASGTAVLLETARLLADLGRELGIRPGRAIRFVSFGSEEQGLQGSSAFVARHYGPDPLPRLSINLDELATGNMKGVVLQFPELRTLVQAQLDTMNEGFACHVLAQLDPSGDLFPFSRIGVPSAMLWRWRFVGRHPDTAFGHSSSDTPDKVRFRELKEYAGHLARLLLRLSHVPPADWPENQLDPRAIARRLDNERGTVLRTM